MTEGFLKSKREIISNLDSYKEAMGLDNVSDSLIDEWAVLHYVNKLIIPEETYTTLVKQGRVISGFPQFARYIDTLSEANVKELNDILGVDLKNDPMSVIDDAMRKRAQNLETLTSLNAHVNKIMADLYRVRKADNFKYTALINDKVVSPEMPFSGPIKMQNGEVKLLRFDDGKQIAVAKDDKGYTIALGNEEGEINFNATSKPMSEKQLNTLLNKVKESEKTDEKQVKSARDEDKKVKNAQTENTQSAKKSGLKETVDTKETEKKSVKEEIADTKKAEKKDIKKDGSNSSALATIASGCYYKSSSKYKLAQSLNDVNKELVNSLNENQEDDTTKGRILPISLKVFEKMAKSGDLKGLEIKRNDYLILKSDTQKIYGLLKEHNISFKPNMLIAKAAKVLDIMQEGKEGDSYNKHNLSNFSTLLDNLDKNVEYIFKGQADARYELVVKDVDYKGDPILYVLEIGGTKVLNDIKEEVNTLLTAYGRRSFENYLNKMRSENRVLYEAEKEIAKLKESIAKDCNKAKEQLDHKTVDKLEDFGRKIETARKYQYKRYTLEELKNMGAAEKSKNITRDKLWKRPDYLRMYNDLLKSKSETESKAQIYLLNEMRKAIWPTVDGHYLHVSDEVYQQYTSFVNAIQEFSSREFKNPYYVVKELSSFLESKGIVIFNDKGRGVVASGYSRAGMTVSHFVNEFLGNYKDLGTEKNFSSWHLRRGLNEYQRKGFFDKKETTAKTETTTKNNLKNYTRLEHIHRDGTDYRSSKNIGEKEMIRDRGINSVTFGNWLNAEDRQIELNYVYDALGDLAEILGIDYRSTSLSDVKVENMKEASSLGICLGSNGRGLAGGISTAAHYEPSTNIINLTKAYGAGSLGHEWWHALDAYLIRALSNDVKMDSIISGYNAFKYNTKIQTAVTQLKDSIKYIKREVGVDVSQRKNKINRDIADRQSELNHLLARAVSFAKREKLWIRKDRRTNTHHYVDYSKVGDAPEKAAKMLQDIVDAKSYSNAQDEAAFYHELLKKVSALNELIKKHTGRQAISMAKSSTLSLTDMDRLRVRVKHIRRLQLDLDSVQEKEARSVLTNYYNDAGIAQRSGYWADWKELGARAFASYLCGKARAKGIHSDYLSGHGEYNHFAFERADEKGRACSYPEGEEATQIYAAFDNLFKVLKEEKLLKAVEHDSDAKKVKYSFDTDKHVETTADGNNIFVDHATAETFANRYIRGFATMSGNEKADMIRVSSMGLAYGLNEKDLSAMINMSNIMKIRFSLDNTLNTALGVFEVKNGTRYILINPKSKQNALAVMLHEMVHAMSGTKEYTDFKKSILQYHKNEYDIIKKDIVLDKVNTEYEKIEGRTMSEELIDEESVAYYVQYKLYELARDKITEKYSKNVSPKGFYQKLRSYIGKMRDKLVEMKDPYAKEVNALYKSFSNMTGAKVTTTADTYKESILYTTDNRKVYKVDNDVFKVLNNYKHKDIIAEYLKDNKVVIGNSEIYITRRTRNEYLYSRSALSLQKAGLKDKIRLVDNIEELLTASDNYVNEGLKHKRKDNFVEFARGNVLLDVFGKKYKAEVIVGKTNEDILELYDIVKIRKADFAYKKESHQQSLMMQSRGRSLADSPINNLAHNEDNVNNKNAKYSIDLPGTENILTEMPGREDTVSFFKKPTSEKKKVLTDNFTKWWDKFNTSMINAQHVIEKYANKSLQILTNSKRHYKLDGADARARAESVRGLMQAARTAD